MITRTDEIRAIKSYARWPWYPYLPVKRHVNDKTETGIIRADCLLKVYIDVNLFAHVSLQNHNLDHKQTILYKSFDELLDAWTVD